MMSAWFASAAQAAPVAGCASTLTNGTPARWSRAAAAAILGAWISPNPSWVRAPPAVQRAMREDGGRRRTPWRGSSRRRPADAGAEEGVIEDDDHRLAPPIAPCR